MLLRSSFYSSTKLLTAAVIFASACYLNRATSLVTFSNQPSANLFSASAGSPTIYAFPLRVSKNGRYLIDQQGRPFRIQGDSAQSLIANLTYAEADAYLTDRKSKGFNTINVNLLEHKFAINAPKNRRGDPPFRVADTFSAPNDAYFDFADSIIDLAASKGLFVTLAPMYLGYGGHDEGWWSALTNRGNAQEVCYNFGLYVGKRYKNRPNILWVIGGDFTPPPGSEGEKRLHKFMEGIKAAGASQLWSGDWNAPCISTDVRAFASQMDVNAIYTYGMSGHDGLTYAESRAAFNYSPTRPAYLKETGYEDEVWLPGDPASVRKYEYWAILGGATAGAFFGHRDIWNFATSRWSSGLAPNPRPWQTVLNSPGSLDMMRLGKLLDAVAWYRLVPSSASGMKVLISAGGGTYGKQDYVAAAATDDGSLLLAYVPPTASSPALTINMDALAAAATARWFDPTTGAYIEVSGGLLHNSGSKTFTIPGMNSAGASDWVLVIATRKHAER